MFICAVVATPSVTATSTQRVTAVTQMPVA
jgi:hypothetical protein